MRSSRPRAGGPPTLRRGADSSGLSAEQASRSTRPSRHEPAMVLDLRAGGLNRLRTRRVCCGMSVQLARVTLYTSSGCSHCTQASRSAAPPRSRFWIAGTCSSRGSRGSSSRSPSCGGGGQRAAFRPRAPEGRLGSAGARAGGAAQRPRDKIRSCRRSEVRAAVPAPGAAPTPYAGRQGRDGGRARDLSRPARSVDAPGAVLAGGDGRVVGACRGSHPRPGIARRGVRGWGRHDRR